MYDRSLSRAYKRDVWACALDTILAECTNMLTLACHTDLTVQQRIRRSVMSPWLAACAIHTPHNDDPSLRSPLRSAYRKDRAHTDLCELIGPWHDRQLGSCGRPGGDLIRSTVGAGRLPPMQALSKTSKNEQFVQVLYQLLTQLATQLVTHAITISATTSGQFQRISFSAGC